MGIAPTLNDSAICPIPMTTIGSRDSCGSTSRAVLETGVLSIVQSSWLSSLTFRFGYEIYPRRDRTGSDTKIFSWFRIPIACFLHSSAFTNSRFWGLHSILRVGLLGGFASGEDARPSARLRHRTRETIRFVCGVSHCSRFPMGAIPTMRRDGAE